MGLYAGITPTTIGLDAMPIGSGMTTRGGYLVVWSGNLIWFSDPDNAHLTDLEMNVIQLPDAVLGCVGVDGGLWAVTARSAYWVGSPNLMQAPVAYRQSTRRYAAGGTRFPAEYTGLQTSSDVAAFVSSDGPVFGTADGQLNAPLAPSQLWDVAGKTAEVVPVEQNGTKIYAVGVF
jgi:hypothetical protein